MFHCKSEMFKFCNSVWKNSTNFRKSFQLPPLNENIDLAFGFFNLNFKILFLEVFFYFDERDITEQMEDVEAGPEY